MGNAMKLQRRRFLHLAAGAAALPTVSRIAHAQSYPSRPITMIVPYPAGGATDTIARILTERMRTSLGQPVIVENMAGAGGSVGVGRAARAAPDGYTLSIGHLNTHVFNGAVYALKYDIVNDFEPVSLLVNVPTWVIARTSFPAKDLKELVTWLKANPDRASVATTGPGSAAHLSAIYFMNQTGTQFQVVPYRGAGPVMTDLIAGHIDLEFGEASTALQFVRSGQIKALAIMAKSHWFAAPDVPTVDEVGAPGLYISFWHGLWVPKGTPKDIIGKLNAAVMDALADSVVRQRLAEAGQEIPPRDQQTPEALRVLQKSEIDKWWPIIKAANIKAE
jgi:tripartite-type tricarboxylate transporter receptor subunit TctC